ncbi:hypothetical protein GQ600_5701 [Phytophthora cactorum]|nr:hypothetical protein GQ600_5701 [Phytophthora cactorum]
MGKKSRRQRLNAGKPPPTKATDASASHAVDTQHLKLDPRGDGMYSGTFRWLESKVFPQLPPFPSTPPGLRVLVVGASQKAEQRVWRISNYWNEVAAFYAKTKVTLFFIGPEVDERDADGVKEDQPGNLAVRHFRGTFGDFQDSQLFSDCTADTSVILAAGSPLHRRVEDPAIFTCANDYADMNGEFAVQSRIVGANMLLLPSRTRSVPPRTSTRRKARYGLVARKQLHVCCLRSRQGTTIQCDCGDVGALQKRLDAELDIHLEDKLGRHFYKGMVLTKDQAARCKALTGKQAPSETPGLHNDAPQSQLETPRFELMPGQRENEIVAVILVPRIKSASEQIAVDLTDSVLTVFVPGKYLLKTKLPFQVDQAAGSLQAVLTPPILRVSFRKK